MKTVRKLLVGMMLGCAVFTPSANATDLLGLKKQATWKWSEGEAYKGRFEEWVSAKLEGEASREALASIGAIGPLRGVSLFERNLEIAGLCDPSIREFVATLKSEWTVETFGQVEATISSLNANGAIPAWFKPDLQLAYCRELVHHGLYDEAMQKLQTVGVDTVSDPSTWMFCMAICQHHLLQKTPCEETLEKLLQRETELPTRYAVTARLMQADIKPLKTDSLDEVARMMNDVERRLSLGRAGKQVRDEEQAIIEKLEKMIDKMEKQMQQQKQQSKNSKGSGGSQQQKPMEKSQAAGGPKVDGEVDNKDVGNKSGWGNLPPAERQEALQSMTKDLPSHYREVIEAYFKRLATSQNQP